MTHVNHNLKIYYFRSLLSVFLANTFSLTAAYLKIIFQQLDAFYQINFFLSGCLFCDAHLHEDIELIL